MKKVIIVILCIVLILSFNACGKSITLEEAKDIAVSHAKISPDDVTFTKTEVDKELTGTEYEIEFVCPVGTYEYEISDKGKIISVKAETTQLPSDIAPDSSSSEAITESQALDIVLKDIGIEKKDVKSSKIHIDNEDGIYVYEVDLKVGNDKYDYEINAVTGDIVKCEREVG